MSVGRCVSLKFLNSRVVIECRLRARLSKGREPICMLTGSHPPLDSVYQSGVLDCLQPARAPVAVYDLPRAPSHIFERIDIVEIRPLS